jgi:hypothetical protein
MLLADGRVGGWNENCVYLEPKVRDEFLKAVNLEHTRRSSKQNIDEVNQHIDKTFEFPNLLFASTQLPPSEAPKTR